MSRQKKRTHTYVWIVGKGGAGFGGAVRFTDYTDCPEEVRSLARFLYLHPEIHDLSWTGDDGMTNVIKRKDADGNVSAAL